MRFMARDVGVVLLIKHEAKQLLYLATRIQVP